MRSAIAVFSEPGQIRAFRRLSASAAFDRCGIHQPEIIGSRRAGSGERSDDVVEQLTGVTEALVVAGPVGDVGEPRAQVRLGVADESGFGRETEQGLDDGKREQFCVGEFRGDPNGGSFRRPLRVGDEHVIDGDVESCGEGVQVRVHALFLQDQGLCSPLILDTIATHVVDDRAERANPLELLV